MSDVFMHLFGVDVSIVSEVKELEEERLGRKLSDLSYGTVLEEAQDAVKNRRLYRCTNCLNLLVTKRISETMLISGRRGVIYNAIRKKYGSLKEEVTYNTRSIKECHYDAEKDIIVIDNQPPDYCDWCLSPRVRLVHADGSVAYEEGDKRPQQVDTKHFMCGDECCDSSNMGASIQLEETVSDDGKEDMNDMNKNRFCQESENGNAVSTSGSSKTLIIENKPVTQPVMSWRNLKQSKKKKYDLRIQAMTNRMLKRLNCADRRNESTASSVGKKAAIVESGVQATIRVKKLSCLQWPDNRNEPIASSVGKSVQKPAFVESGISEYQMSRCLDGLQKTVEQSLPPVFNVAPHDIAFSAVEPFSENQKEKQPFMKCKCLVPWVRSEITSSSTGTFLKEHRFQDEVGSLSLRSHSMNAQTMNVINYPSGGSFPNMQSIRDDEIQEHNERTSTSLLIGPGFSAPRLIEPRSQRRIEDVHQVNMYKRNLPYHTSRRDLTAKSTENVFFSRDPRIKIPPLEESTEECSNARASGGSKSLT